MLSVNSSSSSLLAVNNLKKAAADEKTSVSRLSTGRASASPGDRVTEESIATGLGVQNELMGVAENTVSQAKEVLNVGASAAEELLKTAIRQSSIAARSVSDNITDSEREINNTEFQRLASQHDVTARQATYNKVTLLTGAYTGDSFVETAAPGGEKVYDITDINQYVAHGVIGENLVLAKNSGVEITDKVGKEAASGKISFSENLMDGDGVIVGGKKFTAVDTSIHLGTLEADQFELGNTLDATLENLVSSLSKSSFAETQIASYSYQYDATSGSGALHILSNAKGSVGNDVAIGVEMALADPNAAIDVNDTAHGILQFSSVLNMNEGYSVNVNGHDFTAVVTTGGTLAAGQFKLGANMRESIQNLTAVLNNSPLLDVNAASYTVLPDGHSIDIQYRKPGMEGNAFSVNVAPQGDAVSFSSDLVDIVKFATVFSMDSTGTFAASNYDTKFLGFHFSTGDMIMATFATTAAQGKVVAETDHATTIENLANYLNDQFADNNLADQFVAKADAGRLTILSSTLPQNKADMSKKVTFYAQWSGVNDNITRIHDIDVSGSGVVDAAALFSSRYQTFVPTVMPTGAAVRAVGTLLGSGGASGFTADQFVRIKVGGTDYTFTAGNSWNTSDRKNITFDKGSDLDSGLIGLAEAINFVSNDTGVYALADAVTHTVSLTAYDYGKNAGDIIKVSAGEGGTPGTLHLSTTGTAGTSAIINELTLNAFSGAGSADGTDGEIPVIVPSMALDGEDVDPNAAAGLTLSGGSSIAQGRDGVLALRVKNDDQAVTSLTIDSGTAITSSVVHTGVLTDSHTVSRALESFYGLATNAKSKGMDIRIGAVQSDAVSGDEYFDVYISPETFSVGDRESFAAKSLTFAGTANVKMNESVAYASIASVLASGSSLSDHITAAIAAASGDPISGTVSAVDGANPVVTNKIAVNDGGQSVPANGKLEGTLMNGTDYSYGTKAQAVVGFSGSGNFTVAQEVYLNGLGFVFEQDSTSGTNLALPNVALGTDLKESLNNLVAAVNSSVGDASKAFLQYDEAKNEITFTYKEEGAAGNDYRFNFGGTSVQYDVGQGVTTTSQDFTLGKLASLGLDGAVAGEDAKQVTFSQDLQGEISGFKAIFEAGHDDGNTFTSNGIKFMMLLGGERYESEIISLAGANPSGGGSGFQNLGDTLAGGTEIVFAKVGGVDTAPGLKLKVSSAGLKIAKSDSVYSIQEELNSISNNVNTALITGQLKVGVSAPFKSIPSYGLDGIDKFKSNDIVVQGSHFDGGVKISGTTGLTTAQGVIAFKNNTLSRGDHLHINGTQVTFAQDVSIGRSLHETMVALVKYLNLSKDQNLGQATYRLDDLNRLVITSKITGTAGNEITLQGSVLAGGGNGVSINGGPSAEETGEKKIFEFEGSVSDKMVRRGSDRVFADERLPQELLGGFDKFNAEFIEGSVDGTSNLVSRNMLKFSAIINNNAYSGTVELSGGGRDGQTTYGRSYNSLGDFLVGGTSIVLESDDKRSSISFKIDADGLTLDGDDKSEVIRHLGEIVADMNSGVEKVLIGQERVLGGLNMEDLKSSALRGLKAGNVSLLSADFDEDGRAGLVSKFDYDANTSELKVKIGGEAYSQVLSDSATFGGLGDRFDSVSGVIRGGADTTLRLKKEDGFGYLNVNLTGVSDIDVSGEDSIGYLTSSLNSLFNSSESAGLSFQVGIRSEDKVVLNFPDLRTKALYRDENGDYAQLKVSDKASAQKSLEILENVVRVLRKEKANMGASYSQFESILSILRTSINAGVSAISVLSDADMPKVTMDHSLSLLRANAAASGLVHSLQSVKDIMNRLLQS